jgi:hypothetical protein
MAVSKVVRILFAWINMALGMAYSQNAAGDEPAWAGMR